MTVALTDEQLIELSVPAVTFRIAPLNDELSSDDNELRVKVTGSEQVSQFNGSRRL